MLDTNNKKNELLNISQDNENEQDSTSTDDNLKKIETPSLTTPRTNTIIKTHKVLDYIKEHNNCNKAEISRALGIAYTSVADVCKMLEFARLIMSRVVVNEMNNSILELYIPKSEEEEKRDDNHNP